jgi:hypothetical protein
LRLIEVPVVNKPGTACSYLSPLLIEEELLFSNPALLSFFFTVRLFRHIGNQTDKKLGDGLKNSAANAAHSSGFDFDVNT